MSLITIKARVRFAESTHNVEEGIKHLQNVLSVGSSREIDIQMLPAGSLCEKHLDLSIDIIDILDTLEADITICVPQCLSGKGTGVSLLISQMLYCTSFSFISKMFIEDFEVADSDLLQEYFTGSNHGISAIRKLFSESSGPLIGLILKPRTRIDISSQELFVKRALDTKSIDYLIDDELVVSPFCLTYKNRIDEYTQLIDKFSQRSGQSIQYWVNAAADIEAAEEIIEYGLNQGIKTFSLNAVTMGFAAVKYLIHKYTENAVFMVSNVGRGVLTRQDSYYVSEKLLAKLTRLIGADAVYTGPISSEFPYNVEMLTAETEVLQKKWECINPCFAVVSGNIGDGKTARENIRALGKNAMIQMGSSLFVKDDVDGKMKAFKFLVENALNDSTMKYLEDTFETKNEEEIKMSKTDSIRLNNLEKNLEEKIRLMEQIDHSLLMNENPIYTTSWQTKLADCENGIITDLVEIFELAETDESIDISVVFTSRIAKLCQKYANNLTDDEKQALNNQFGQVFEDIQKESQGSQTEQIKTELRTTDSLDLTIPIIPTILTYKKSFSVNTSKGITKAIANLLAKIKGKQK